MFIGTVRHESQEELVIICEEYVYFVTNMNAVFQTTWSTNLQLLLQKNELKLLQNWFEHYKQDVIEMCSRMKREEACFVAPYRKPNHIFGVGMNYIEKAEDLKALPLEEAPVIFLKPNSALIGPNEVIELPIYSSHVTAEGELAIVIGEVCHNVSEEDALKYVAAYTASLDMTAKDIHAKNPRFVQAAKLFKSFFSFGPYLMTPDEVSDLAGVSVASILNGEVTHLNTVSNMIYNPAFIISYISKFVTLLPGDIIMTGTPGSYRIIGQDEATCRVGEYMELCNNVVAND